VSRMRVLTKYYSRTFDHVLAKPGSSTSSQGVWFQLSRRTQARTANSFLKRWYRTARVALDGIGAGI
jgi:hypothetical protein